MDDHVKVNNALALTQHITQTLEPDAATCYLLAVEALSIDDWREARDLLISTDHNSRNRQTKEAFIKDIVNAFGSQVVDTKYLIGDLSILPGLSRSAVELASYTSSIVYAVKQITRHAAGTVLENFSAPHARSTSPTPLTSQGDSPNPQQKFYSSAVKHGQFNSHNTRQEGKKETNIKQKSWTHGKSHSTVEANQPPQFSFQCIGIKSGPRETSETLEKEFKSQWKGLQNLTIEPYSSTEYNTLFRVKFDIPTTMKERLSNPSCWPSRMSVRPWKGNPKAVLKPLRERIYTKKIYVGNLAETMTTEKLNRNLHTIYKEELQNGKIAKIECYKNTAAWKRQQQQKSHNPNHTVRQSMCLVLTSEPGQNLEDVGLKQNHYEINLRRAVRPWNGPIPWPEDHERVKPVVELSWQ